MASRHLGPRRPCVFWASLLAIAGCLRLMGTGFTGPTAAAPTRIARASFETGKVNVGVELQEEPAEPPQPVLECDEACMTAIYDCIEEGCSVDALMKLDTQLARDEQKIVGTVSELKDTQKTAYTPENAGTLAWLGNFLSRSGSLRAQLQALRRRGLWRDERAAEWLRSSRPGFLAVMSEEESEQLVGEAARPLQERAAHNLDIILRQHAAGVSQKGEAGSAVEAGR
mmetsp:Transcript_48935/g.141768  ORF Transcript_48935/g.141768 Transcript_48935/m.141768 type:complete len:227 (+) Transcript_48935:71-751(+)